MRISDWSSDVCSSDLLVCSAGEMLMPAGSAGFAAWAVPRSAMVDSWIGALSGSSVHVPSVASLLLQGVEEDSRRLRVVAVLRRVHIHFPPMPSLAQRDRTPDLKPGPAFHPALQV